MALNILIKSAKIIDPKSNFHQQVKDILIENNFIKRIAKNISCQGNTKEIHLENLHVSCGWFDSSVCLGEPGYEDRETIRNGLEVAAKSGFTAVGLNPYVYPFIDDKTGIYFVKSASEHSATTLYPIACATEKNEGKQMVELYDLKQSGAIAFGDYNQPLYNENLLKIILLYIQNFNGLLLSFPYNKNIAGQGVVNESTNSVLLGLKSMPNLAESLQIIRDIEILKYTGGKLHIPTISCAESVTLIAKAKQEGLNITCSVAAHHLILTDDFLKDFDTRYKVLPPLRDSKDREALLEGLKKGIIDAIVSDHNPINIENKKVSFNDALYGSIGMESLFPVLNNLLDTEMIIEHLTYKPRAIFGLKTHSITEGNIADITLFNPEGKGIFTKQKILSKSKNSIFLNTSTRGKVYGIINNKQFISK